MLAHIPRLPISLDPLIAEAKRPGRQRRALIAIVGALMAPMLFFLIFGVIAFARARDYRNQLRQLASEGARAAAVSRNLDGTRLSSTNRYSIQQQLVTTYAKQR
jgi:Flp pilus assembly protein TadG